MPVVRVIIIFLCGVAITVGAYVSGVAQRVPGWLGYGETTVVATPPTTVVTSTQGDATVVTTPQTGVVTTNGTAVVTPPGDLAGPPPVNGDNNYDDAIDEAPNAYSGVYPTNGYPTNGPPPVITKTEGVLANGSPLRVNIYRSQTGFEARCTAYKIINRSQRVLMLSFDPRYNSPDAPVSKEAGTLLKPGETLDEDSFPVDCAEFHSLFSEGPNYGPPGRYGRGRGFGGPVMKIEIEDCPQDSCAVAQF